MFLLNEYKIINYVTIFSFISFLSMCKLHSYLQTVVVSILILKFFVFQIVDINRSRN